MTRTGLIKRVAVVTGVLLAAVNYVAYFRLGIGGTIPDLIPLGATPEQVFFFRDGLRFAGKQEFNGAYRVLDFGLICFLTGLIALLAQQLRPKRYWWSVLGFGLVFALADLTENYVLAQIINAVPDIQDATLPGYVNIATRIKFAALLMAGAAWITVWRQDGEGA